MSQNLFETAKEIFDLSPKLRTGTLDEQLKVADLLERIGHIIDDAKNKLLSGQVPESRSQQIALLSEELYFRLSFNVGEIKAQSLSNRLRVGYEEALLAHQLANSRITQNQFTSLEAAVGYFIKTSNNLRASLTGKEHVHVR